MLIGCVKELHLYVAKATMTDDWNSANSPGGTGVSEMLELLHNSRVLRMLAGLGFANVDVALDGREAVTKAERKPPLYDLILMDINMPVQDGVSATRELRQKGVKIPIVAMTANALKGHAETYIAKGMSGYIAKPVDRDLLIKLLLKCLKRQGDG
jgi:osomolarity two-component system, sensor histidine kinase TcsA